MEIGVLTLQIHLDAAQSLKDKRRVIKSLTGRVRARHNVAVAEVDHHDLHQLSLMAFLGVASGRDALEKMFDQIVTEAEKSVPGDVVEEGREFLG
jgi:uncharacterized protein YlxP (DUF503 family)